MAEVRGVLNARSCSVYIESSSRLLLEGVLRFILSSVFHKAMSSCLMCHW